MELRNYYGDIFIMICLKFITSLSDVNVIDYSYLSVDIVFKKYSDSLDSCPSFNLLHCSLAVANNSRQRVL